MNLTKRTLVIALAVASALPVTVSSVSAQDIHDKQSSATSRAQARTIRGVWRTAVTPRNCQTGEPVFSLSGLFTFNAGGTMSEYGIGPGSSPASGSIFLPGTTTVMCGATDSAGNRGPERSPSPMPTCRRCRRCRGALPAIARWLSSSADRYPTRPVGAASRSRRFAERTPLSTIVD
jgi:hypothetical protein